MIGHTLGHSAIAVEAGERWLLYAGDAYFYYQEMDLARPRCTPGLRFYQTLMEKDRRARLDNQHRLRQFKRQQGHEVELFCAHDIHEFERVSGRPASRPAAALSTG